MIVSKTVFNPRGIMPEEYIMKYPELREKDETRKLKGIELMWCWYYSNNESPFVKKKINHYVKCDTITELIFDQINKGKFYDEKTINNLREGNIPSSWKQAIDFFKHVDTDSRSTAKDMIDIIFDRYMDIINGGIENFKNEDDEVDYSKYVNTMKKIQDELPGLIKLKEVGFGSSDTYIDSSDTITEGSYWNEMYLKSK